MDGSSMIAFDDYTNCKHQYQDVLTFLYIIK